MSAGLSWARDSCRYMQQISLAPALHSHIPIKWAIECNGAHCTDSESEGQEGEFMYPSSCRLFRNEAEDLSVGYILISQVDLG